MRPSAFAVLAIFATHATLAAAEPARVKLTYARGDGPASVCPDEATFRTLVLARLGYDPFDPSAPRELRVELRPEGAEITGRLVLTGQGNEKPAQRTLRSGDADCFELTSSLALAAAIAVDPDAVRAGTTRPQPTPTPQPPAPQPPVPRPPTPPPTPPPQRERSPWEPADIGGRLSAAFVMPFGITPAPRGGVRAGAAIDGGIWSLGAEGVVFFPSATAGDAEEATAGEVSTLVVHGALVPCAHLPLHAIVLLDLCAVGSVGAMFSDATGVTRSDPRSHLFATVGPRAGVSLMPWEAFGFALAVDVPINLERAHLVIEDGGVPREVWAASRVGLVAGLGLVFRIR